MSLIAGRWQPDGGADATLPLERSCEAFEGRFHADPVVGEPIGDTGHLGAVLQGALGPEILCPLGDEATAEELGATWLLTSYRMDLDELRQGPPT